MSNSHKGWQGRFGAPISSSSSHLQAMFSSGSMARICWQVRPSDVNKTLTHGVTNDLYVFIFLLMVLPGFSQMSWKNPKFMSNFLEHQSLRTSEFCCGTLFRL